LFIGDIGYKFPKALSPSGRKMLGYIILHKAFDRLKPLALEPTFHVFVIR
jgi:hypothetical protein